MLRRTLLAGLLMLAAHGALAQGYPSRPVKLVVGSTPEAFGRLMREEVAKWAEVVKISGASAD